MPRSRHVTCNANDCEYAGGDGGEDGGGPRKMRGGDARKGGALQGRQHVLRTLHLT